MRILGVFAVILTVVGCSSSTDAPAGGAGASGADGTGGSAGKLPAQAAFSIILETPTANANQMSCPVLAQEYQLGAPNAPNDVSPGDGVVDGTSGARISCSVTGKGPYSFSGTIRATSLEGDPVTLIITKGMLLESTYQGTASISLNTPQLANTFSSAMPCTVQAINQQAKPGAIWAQFTCGEITQPPSLACGLRGEFVLENCAGS